MDLYAENILDHYRSPRGKGTIDSYDITHKEVNTSCGDELSIGLKIDDGKIAELAWEGTGCAISQAGMSILFEGLIGMNLDEAEKLTTKQIEEMLGVPIGPRRVKCAMLCLHALKNALRAAEGKEAQSWTETLQTGL